MRNGTANDEASAFASENWSREGPQSLEQLKDQARPKGSQGEVAIELIRRIFPPNGEFSGQDARADDQ